MIVSGLWLFIMVPWVSLQCVIVVFPDHTYFFQSDCNYMLVTEIMQLIKRNVELFNILKVLLGANHFIHAIFNKFQKK